MVSLLEPNDGADECTDLPFGQQNTLVLDSGGTLRRAGVLYAEHHNRQKEAGVPPRCLALFNSPLMKSHASTRTPARLLPTLPPLPDRASQSDGVQLSAR